MISIISIIFFIVAAISLYFAIMNRGVVRRIPIRKVENKVSFIEISYSLSFFWIAVILVLIGLFI